MLEPDGIIASSPRHDRSVRRLLDEIGDERLIQALEDATAGEPRDQLPSPMRQWLERLADPKYTDYTPVQHMRELGISTLQVLEAVRKLDVGLAVANSGRRLMKVVDGLGEAAEPRWAICPNCMGEGFVVDKAADADPVVGDADLGEQPLTDLPVKKCLILDGGCDGSGKVRLKGSLEAAKLFLEVHGLKRGSGGGGGSSTNITVPVQQINNPGNDGRSPSGKTVDVTTRVQDILANGS